MESPQTTHHPAPARRAAQARQRLLTIPSTIPQQSYTRLLEVYIIVYTVCRFESANLQTLPACNPCQSLTAPCLLACGSQSLQLQILICFTVCGYSLTAFREFVHSSHNSHSLLILQSLQLQIVHWLTLTHSLASADSLNCFFKPPYNLIIFSKFFLKGARMFACFYLTALLSFIFKV